MSRYDILLNDPKSRGTTGQPDAESVPDQRPSDRPTNRSPDEPTATAADQAKGRGELIRRGFEWYADQLRALKTLSLEEQMEGRPGSMSAMVREALDEYLKKRMRK